MEISYRWVCTLNAYKCRDYLHKARGNVQMINQECADEKLGMCINKFKL